MRLSGLERGAGPPLVHLHGVGSSAAGWEPQLDEFSRGRDRAGPFRVLAWDMPGYGSSEPLDPPTFPRYAECLRDWLRDRGAHGLSDADRPILVGHSIGGMIVQEFLVAYPGEARAVVLYATSPAFGRKDGAWQQQFLRARLGPLDAGHTLRELAPGIVRSLVGPRATAGGVALAERCLAAVPDAAYRAALLCLAEFDRRASLAAIDIPCLVVAGEADTNTPLAMQQVMASKIAGAGLVALPGLGHLAHLEDPAAFNEALWQFLERLP